MYRGQWVATIPDAEHFGHFTCGPHSLIPAPFPPALLGDEGVGLFAR